MKNMKGKGSSVIVPHIRSMKNLSFELKKSMEEIDALKEVII
jgi:hypothetical protein